MYSLQTFANALRGSITKYPSQWGGTNYTISKEDFINVARQNGLTVEKVGVEGCLKAKSPRGKIIVAWSNITHKPSLSFWSSHFNFKNIFPEDFVK